MSPCLTKMVPPSHKLVSGDGGKCSLVVDKDEDTYRYEGSIRSAPCAFEEDNRIARVPVRQNTSGRRQGNEEKAKGFKGFDKVRRGRWATGYFKPNDIVLGKMLRVPHVAEQNSLFYVVRK